IGVNTLTTCSSLRIVVTTTNRQKAGRNWQEAADWFSSLLKLIDAGEAGAFGDLDAVQSYLTDVVVQRVQRYADGHTETKPTYLMVAAVSYQPNKTQVVDAFVNGCGSDIPVGEASLVINLNGAFWSSIRRVN